MNRYFFGAAALFFACSVQAQDRQLTAADYERAQRFLSTNAEQLVDHAVSRPDWLPGDRLLLRDAGNGTVQYLLADAKAGKLQPAFDHKKLAAALSASQGPVRANALPISGVELLPDGQNLRFFFGGRLYTCNLKTYQLQAQPGGQPPSRRRSATGKQGDGPANRSPDGSKAVFIRSHNLWLRDLKNGQETLLTTDGVKDYGYATDNAGWKSSDAAIVAWSPDSRKVATFKQDQRHLNDMYLVSTNVGAPRLKQWKYALPSDQKVAMIERVIIDVAQARVIPILAPADPHRATLSDDISSSGTLDDVQWNADASRLAFVSTSRYHNEERVRLADAATGKVTELFEEKVKTQYESGWGTINWRFLDKSNELIWFSERDDWGHLYLYDSRSGKLKNRITTGSWVVTQLLRVDEEKRQAYFIARGLQEANPYFAQLCRIGLDGKNFKVLTPEAGNHRVEFSESGKYFADSWSSPDQPGSSTIRDLDGKIRVRLPATDISRLLAAGWKAPQPFTVKANDGKTDLYGLLYTPANLEPGKKYPVIDYIYPGPQGGSIGGNWSFAAARRDNQALASLGFIVVELEGSSNPLRSKSFHDQSYGNMAENTLADQVAGIKELARRYPYMDLDRVGIWGHSGGGFATAAAMFRYPDFFKVGIAESGNHDNRNYEDDWGDRYNGPISDEEYARQANQTYAANLKGKLMLAHGMMDDNVPPYNTLLVVEALQKANKDFDLVVFPNSAHGFGAYNTYMMRRRWDYFVSHLMAARPPKEFKIEIKPDVR
ncbi:S9 family peptidase [Pedobacter yulinensis]|uniref:S9 family peptidase n=1 Tax=Pedobacter yulinensis TaxID=2126353 RepID=A0A2T3HKF0_9SPHI|nr:DPP IV N-terminal domain-containing protein [Pedobacter yulinensis]PST82861.1 S9 family peptidase [Pedobacter yulinensis]